MVLNYICIFLGGGLGSILRYALTQASLAQFGKSYWGTLLVNVVGAFLLVFLQQKTHFQSKLLETAIKVGFLGALTTFSTFSFEILKMYSTGNYVQALLHFGLNIFFGIIIFVFMFR